MASYVTLDRTNERNLVGYTIKYREWKPEKGKRVLLQETVYGKEARDDALLKRTAQEKRELADLKNAGAVMPNVDGDTPIGRFVTEWLPRYKNSGSVGEKAYDQTLREMRKWVLPQLKEWGIVTVSQLTLDVGERLRDERVILRGGPSNGAAASDGTKNRVVSVLQALGRDVVKYGYLESNPFEHLATIETIGQTKVVPVYDELVAVGTLVDEFVIREMGEDVLRGWRASDPMWLLALGAMRWSEGAGLAPEDCVNPKQAKIHRVRERNGRERCKENKQKGKTRFAWREWPIDTHVREVIQRLEAFAKPIECGACGQLTTGRLICDWNGDPLPYDWFKNRLEKARNEVGVNWSIRELRHFGASRWIQVNPNPFEVMKWTGHSKVETLTEVYAQLFPSSTDAMADLVSQHSLDAFR